jgi:hypothetical protein
VGVAVSVPAAAGAGSGMTCFAQGAHDAQRGHTANPYGASPCADEWRKGYDSADEQGLAILPRFGKLRRRR